MSFWRNHRAQNQQWEITQNIEKRRRLNEEHLWKNEFEASSQRRYNTWNTREEHSQLKREMRKENNQNVEKNKRYISLELENKRTKMYFEKKS